ncbi:MAG: PilC/PilY family type IV pilus protein [Desulfoplanes sp.]|nr:PilC/PilY family type IV pilus protein [Desulfoplanes sp.]
MCIQRLKCSMLVLVLILLSCVENVWAEDVDAFAASVRSNAMLAIDTSGSMEWPVYNHDIDYEAFFSWAVSNGYASDRYDSYDKGLGYAYDNFPWEKNKIYLVSAYIGYSEITGPDGKTYSVIGDPMYSTMYLNLRKDWVTGGIIDTGWEINDWDNITDNTISTNAAGYVIYPTLGTDQHPLEQPTDDVQYASSSLAGSTFANNQKILLTNYYTDSRTNIAKDYGFLGYLKAAGVYFSGLFETKALECTLTDDPDAAAVATSYYINSNGYRVPYDRQRIYAFVTGNFLSFITLIEDMKGDDDCADEGWRDVCYQSSSAQWKIVNIGSVENNTYRTRSDYGPNRDGFELHSLVSLSPFTGVKRIALYFENMDIENSSGGGGCNCDNHNSDNDGVYLVNKKGNVFRQIATEFPETDDGKMYGCDTHGWTGYYEVSEDDTLFVKFDVASDGGNSCWGSDRGFRITKIKWTTSEADSESESSGNFSCCNGEDGVGQKIFSRLEVVQQAMKQVVEDTSDTINWGVLRWSGAYPGIRGEAPLGSSVSTIQNAVDRLTADGGTPMGGGMQEAYNYSYDYLAANSDLAACSKNYLLVLTDGFPSVDVNWHEISKGDNHPDFSSSSYHDSDNWAGDPTQGREGEPNYSDDVARWLYNSTEADFNFTTHTIGFGLENPLLQDIAYESNGLHLTAYDQDELINAFYSLGLSMTDSVSFTAPAISVDQANRAQSGDALYMAFFKPVTDGYWQGNLKRYYLKWYTNGTEEVLDATNATATSSNGVFKDTSISFWSSVQDGANVDKGGAGAVLQASIETAFSQKSYYQRAVKTWKDDRMIDFNATTLVASDFGVTNASDRNAIVNFMHGYTYGADINGDPVATREWALGDIIHSEPLIFDYVDTTAARNLTNRYIAVGANDGMLHVFDSETGQEKLAFVPSDLWDDLSQFSDTNQHGYGVDGFLTKYQTGRNPELLVFGERRGGSSYWALNCIDPNPALWTVAWTINPTGDFAELGQSWSKMEIAVDASGDGRDYGIFTGGYDVAEDEYTGTLPAGDTVGRGIFVVDISDGSLVFKASYGVGNGTSVNGAQTSVTRTDMKYCFPGSPTVISYAGNLTIYAVDIASQVWKVSNNGTDWSVYKIFCANGVDMAGGSTAASGTVDKLAGMREYSASDNARKCFTAPEVSYAGDCSTDNPVIYFGTGDMAHPKSSAVHNRFYAVFDMSSNASMIPLDEGDLMNITCDEFDENTSLTAQEQLDLKAVLGDDYLSQAQGWYIRLDAQDDCVGYEGGLDHSGEKVTNSARLFNKKIYFDSYIPSDDDPCVPKGTALFYALGYCYGDSAFDLDATTKKQGISDRYFYVEDSTPPSAINIITGPGGGSVLKASAGNTIVNRFLDSDAGVELYWWKYDDE